MSVNVTEYESHYDMTDLAYEFYFKAQDLK